MEQDSPIQAIRLVEKYTRALERHVITPEEYAPTILSLFDTDAPIDPSLADEICKRIPIEARDLVLRRAEEILSPDYRYILHIGGPGPTSQAREELRVRYEANIRAWAQQLAKALRRRNEE